MGTPDTDSAGVYFLSREAFEARGGRAPEPRQISAADHATKECVNPRSQFFRANVGAVLCRSDGRVLAFERADRPEAWQLPQGGLESGEEPADAVLREVLEETGLERAQLEPLREHPRLLAYELPRDLRSDETGRGQVQYWFYFACSGEPALPSGGEFRAWRWLAFPELVAEVVAFRRAVYDELGEFFARVVRSEL